MENKEKVICESDVGTISYNPFAFICFMLSNVVFISSFLVAASYAPSRYSAFVWISRYFDLYVWFYIGSIFLDILGIIFMYIFKPNLTVTNKRVYGNIGKIKRVDLPINKISAIGTGMFKGFTISSSSGVLHFWGVRNRDQLLNAISHLISEPQMVVTERVVVKENRDNTEELKKYKALLDSGVITQEEFDAKKKQLLGL